jgi:hypothetical protein
MPSPVTSKPRCDAPGCGMFAVGSTDGTEVDSLKRTAVKNVNYCARHTNWPFSDDAKAFTATTAYIERGAK